MTGRPGRGLRILVIHRYYWPDTPPYASLLKAIAGRWIADGHCVDVLSSQPSYKASLDNSRRPSRERIDGAEVYRLTLPPEAGRPVVRILNALRLVMAIWWRALVRRRYDVIMISTVPPVLGGLAAALVGRLRKTRFIYHCMDIHPEIGRISGEFANPLVFRLLQRLDGWSCRAAAAVVVLSQDMADALRARRGSSAWPIHVLNNFSLPADDEPDGQVPFPAEGFTLLFAGNLGRFQGLGTLIDAMGRLAERDDIRLVIMGDGTMRTELEVRARDNGARVQFTGHRSATEAKQAMAHASAGFVSLVPGLYRYAYPSKTMTYLEQGCPVVVAVEPESRLAQDIVNQGVGVAIAPGAVDELAAVVRQLADHPEKQRAYRERAKQVGRDQFTAEVVLPKWSRLLEEL